MFHGLKALVPVSLLSIYHYFLAWLASVWYGHPSRELIVIGVTGTNGKTTTAYLLAEALEASGVQTGCTTTALIKIADKEELNRTKMTMPGRFFLQCALRRMVKANCRYAVIEASSQGMIQRRHIGIDFDVAVFTNLTPEHIEAHGGFENYKNAKKILFQKVASRSQKIIRGQRIPAFAVLNADSPQAAFFASTPGLSSIVWYGVDNASSWQAKDVQLKADCSSFNVRGVQVDIHLVGRHNVENALAALSTAVELGVDLAGAAAALGRVTTMPGRLQRVEAGQPWTVIVDYAPEPESMRRLYEAVDLIQHKRVIHVLGSCGGGRDKARRPILGRLAGERAFIVIVTNEDPYDDDPSFIIDQVAEGARQAGKVDGATLFRIQDRTKAIERAMELAKDGDLVLLTGKGCEPWICVAHGKKNPWNEVEIAQHAIHRALRLQSSHSI